MLEKLPPTQMKLKCKGCGSTWKLNADAEEAFEDILTCDKKGCRFITDRSEFLVRLLARSHTRISDMTEMDNDSDSDYPVPTHGVMQCAITVES
jgi:hypothetical protein